MPRFLTVEELAAARGRPVLSAAGERVGDLEEIYYDNNTGEPEWLGIGTGFIVTKRVVVPTSGAHLSDDAFRLPYTRAQIESSPEVTGDQIDEETALALFDHYGIEPPPPPAPATEGGVATGETPAVTRHEEELLVGKRPVEAGAVRLRKWVETAPVAVDVELQRETVQVRREPIDQPVEGAAIGAQEIEVPVQAEAPVVQKQTVAKERIVVEKGVETETQTIEDEIRREHVEVEGAEPAAEEQLER